MPCKGLVDPSVGKHFSITSTEIHHYQEPREKIFGSHKYRALQLRLAKTGAHKLKRLVINIHLYF